MPNRYVYTPPEPDPAPSVDELSATINGMGAMEANLIAMAQGARDAALYTMSAILSEILVDAQDNYVPIDLGNLREAGDHDRYIAPEQTDRASLSRPTLTQMAVWFAGDVSVSSATVGRLRSTGEGHAGHRMGSRQRRNIRTYGPEHLGFHLQGPQFKEWAFRNPVVYAKDQHENLHYKHGVNFSGTGLGQAKYLERPFNAKVPEILPRLASAIGSAWQGNPGAYTGD